MITHFIAVLAVCGLPTAGADLVPKTDAKVDAELTTAAIQIYNTYRENRPELDARWAALKQIGEAWRAAGCPAGDRDKLLGWLETARQVSQPDSTAALPAAPTFTAEPQKQQLAADLDALEKLANATDVADQVDKKSGKSAAASEPKPAEEKGAKPAQGTSLVGFMRNVIKRLESADEPDAKPDGK